MENFYLLISHGPAYQNFPGYHNNGYHKGMVKKDFSRANSIIEKQTEEKIVESGNVRNLWGFMMIISLLVLLHEF